MNMDLKKRLISVALCVVLLSTSAFAADSNEYYVDTLDRVSSDNLISVLTGSNGWDSTDSQILSNINQNVANIKSYLNNGGTSVASLVYQFYNYFRNTWAPNISDAVLSIENALTSETDGLAKETTLSALQSAFTFNISATAAETDSNHYKIRTNLVNPVSGENIWYVSWGVLMDELYRAFNFVGTNNFGNRTIYTLFSQLVDVVANDEDKAIRDAQKENQQTVQDSFLSGVSSGTSLGKDDYSGLSGVGSTFKDVTSLNGQASLDNFSSGLSGADSAGQGWFSQSTKDALDSVTPATQGVSTFSADGEHMVDEDIYNMAGFEEHYAWLWGDK